MTDEFDRIRDYVSSIPPPQPERLEAARARLDGVLAQQITPDGRATGKAGWWPWGTQVSGSPRQSRKSLLVLGLAALLTIGVVVPIAIGHQAHSGRPASGSHTSRKILVKLVADDVNLTVASGSYDMMYTDTTTPSSSSNCTQEIGSGQAVGGAGGTPAQFCGDSSLSDITGHGTVDTNPYAMVTIGQVGSLGTITLYDNGTDVWEIGGGDYGLNGPGQAGPGASLSGYAGSVEGTVGQEAGALDMQGLASGTGYLDLESTEIQGALPAGTGAVDGVPVTIYKLSMSGLQDPDLSGLTEEQVATIRAADAIIQQSGFSGKTTLVSVDADGYIREVRTTYTLSDGSDVSQDTVLSNFGCAGTVLMPGQAGSTAPPAGCVSPDTARSGATPAPSTTTPTPSSPSSPTSPTSPTSTTLPTSPSTTAPTTASGPVNGPPPSPPPPLTGAAILLQGNGIGSAHFGDTENSAITALDAVLGGSPTESTGEPGKGNCDIDAAVQWANATAYFDAGTFVGYSTLAANGEVLPAGSLVTAQGLRIGDTLTQAQEFYGSSLTTSYAQGGSWSVSTPDGKLDGYLNGEPNQPSVPTIMSIEAGSVGCPAATP